MNIYIGEYIKCYIIYAFTPKVKDLNNIQVFNKNIYLDVSFLVIKLF